MTTLAEIEAAADALPADQKQELLLFIAARLRDAASPLPPPRLFPLEEMNEWIATDNADMARFREAQ